jgi:hypothetical protein
MFRFFLLFVTAMLLLACRSPRSTTGVVSTKDSTMLVLEEGQNLFLEREQMNLTFARLLEDSRCPEGVQCVWAGVAAVELTAMGTFTRPQTLVVATADLPDKGYAKAAVFHRYTFRLTELTPYPAQGDPERAAQKRKIKLTVKAVK